MMSATKRLSETLQRVSAKGTYLSWADDKPQGSMMELIWKEGRCNFRMALSQIEMSTS